MKGQRPCNKWEHIQIQRETALSFPRPRGEGGGKKESCVAKVDEISRFSIPLFFRFIWGSNLV